MAAPAFTAPPPEASPVAATDPSGVPVDSFGVPQDNLFSSYNPNGAAGGLFAPAYIHGYGPSEQAVANWSASKGGLTHAMIANDLLMPEEWAPPQEQQSRGMGGIGGSAGGGIYGSVPDNLTLGKNPKGKIDVEALRALSHGTPYDVQGRRDAIAARLLSNQAAQDEYNRGKATAPPMERGQAYLDYYNEFQKSQMEGYEPPQNKVYG